MVDVKNQSKAQAAPELCSPISSLEVQIHIQRKNLALEALADLERFMTASSPLSLSDQHCRPVVLDAAHLERMTLGDAQLEREVLEIFVRQSSLMLARIAAAEPALAAAAAHRFVGSARGVGAWRVAAAAERVERAASEGSAENFGEAIAELKAAGTEANAAILALLGDASGGRAPRGL
jgi:HPt (histidine-containing phosphotransfer) domain-containing protein